MHSPSGSRMRGAAGGASVSDWNATVSKPFSLSIHALSYRDTYNRERRESGKGAGAAGKGKKGHFRVFF